MIKKFNKRNKEIELTPKEQEFLISKINQLRCQNMLEIGVFRGGVSKLILGTFKNINLYSFDLCQDQQIGELCNKEKYSNWKLFTGEYTYRYIDTINQKFDVVFLDTDHGLPGEILDFLMILPKLKKYCSIFIHDINLPFINIEEHLSISPRLLFSGISGLVKQENENLGFVLVNTAKLNPLDILNFLIVPWTNMDIIKELESLSSYFSKWYTDDFCSRFREIVNFQIKREIQECKLIGK